MKRAIRLTESDLHRIIKESVNRILREEWESPLEKAKKNKNNFDDVKKIDLSKFEKKGKKPKGGTLADLPSSEKLKKLKFAESRFNRKLNEKILLPSMDGNGDVIQCFTNKANINKRFGGGIFGNAIYLKVGTPSEEDYRNYGSSLITVDVANNNLYFGDNIHDAMEAAESGNYDGVVYNSKHDGGEVCVVFNEDAILGKSRM